MATDDAPLVRRGVVEYEEMVSLPALCDDPANAVLLASESHPLEYLCACDVRPCIVVDLGCGSDDTDPPVPILFLRSVASRHPNFLRCFAVATDDRHAFFEYCHLGTVADYTSKPENGWHLDTWARGLASAISHVHKEGWTLGGVRADKVFVAEGGRSVRIGGLQRVRRSTGSAEHTSVDCFALPRYSD